jgi:hypothetical protein
MQITDRLIPQTLAGGIDNGISGCYHNKVFFINVDRFMPRKTRFLANAQSTDLVVIVTFCIGDNKVKMLELMSRILPII